MSQVLKDGELRPLKIDWNQRSVGNKFLYSLYKFMKAIFVSVYFYWLPFIAMIFSTGVPFFFRSQNNNPDNPYLPQSSDYLQSFRNLWFV
jgi:hypothetical protein